MSTVQVGERTIGYDIRGEGEGHDKAREPLLLIAGFGMTRHMWSNDFCDALAARNFTIVRMDNRDTGDSTRLNALGVPDVNRVMYRSFLGLPVSVPYRLEDMADDALGLMKALGFPRFHVAGASMGGMIAQTLASAHPEAVLSLASIMSSPGGRRNSLAKPGALLSIMKPTPQEPEAAKEHLIATFRILGGGGVPFEEARLRELAELHVAAKPSRAGNARQFAAILESGNRRKKLVAQIKAKTVVIHGALDPLLPLRAARNMTATLQGSKLVVVPNMGHDLPTGAYRQVIDAIAENAGHGRAQGVVIPSARSFVRMISSVAIASVAAIAITLASAHAESADAGFATSASASPPAAVTSCTSGDVPGCTAKCNAGDSESCATLGWMYTTGRISGGVPDPAVAVSFLQKSCTGGSSRGCVDLGWMYEVGYGVPQDEHRATDDYGAACTKGAMYGCAHLGSMYENGKYVPRDFVKAAEIYRKACDGGDGMGCDHLGYLYEHGRGVGRDPAHAYQLYKSGCDKADGYACANFGHMIETGEGGAIRNAAQAVQLYKKACDERALSACVHLGSIYEHGGGGEAQDLPRAVKMYTDACAQNEMSGCNDLGTMYETGHGVRKDDAEAVRLYAQSCARKDVVGCANYGWHLYNGAGVATDKTRGDRLLSDACQVHDEWACRQWAKIHPGRRID